MKLEDQVVSLLLAKRLKELGVKQESLFAYGPWGGILLPEEKKRPKDHPFPMDTIAAFTVSELGEMLPWTVYTRRTADKSKAGRIWNCFHNPKTDEFFSQFATTEADARAKMLIYLIEKGLVRT